MQQERSRGATALAVALACCLAHAAAQAPERAFQRVAYRQIGTAEGLPSLGAYGLLEDADGWVWVGTPAGLYRYDGVDFVPYRSARSRQADVHNLRLGPNGRLYCQNFRGQVFRVEHDSLALVGDFEGMHPAFVSYAFRRDSLLVALGDGIRQYALGASGSPVARNRFYRKVSSAQNVLLHPVARAGALLEVPSAASGSLAGFTLAPHYPPAADLFVHDAREQGDSTWFVVETRSTIAPPAYDAFATAGGRITAAHRELPIPPDFAGAGKLVVQAAPDGALLVGGTAGLLRIPPHRGPGPDPHVANLLPGTTVQGLLVDRNGTVWVATATQGLLLLPNLDVRQRQMARLHAPLVGLAAAAGDSLLFGLTRDGSLYRLAPTLERLTAGGLADRLWTTADGEVLCGPTPVYPRPHPRLQRALRVNYGSIKDGALLPDRSIVVATSSRATHFPHRAPARRPGWLDLRAAPTTWRDEAHRATGPTAPWTSLRERRGRSLALDTAGARLLIAYNDSVLVYRPGQPRPTPFAALDAGASAYLLEVAGDRLLVATTRDGLLSIDLATGRRERLLDDRNLDALVAAGDYVWLESSRGLERSALSSRPFAFAPVDQRMGLPGGRPTAFCVGDAYAYAAYGKRVVRIRAAQQARRYASSTLAFAKTSIAGVEQADPTRQPIVLEADEASLELQPRLPNYSQAPGTQFEYRVLGGGSRDTTWQRSSRASASLYFGSMPPGKHELQVRLADEPGTVQRFFIDARLPFWRKPWPYVLATLALAALAIAVLRRRAARRQAEAERQAALRETQLSALAAQMNPHFIFNALNSVQDFMLSNDRLAANDYLTKFARLVRLTLDSSRRALISLDEELHMVATYLDLERVRYAGAVEVALERAEGLRLSALLPPLVVQPYIENAFRHGLHHRTSGRRRLRVRYEMTGPAQLRVVVEDNGVGRTRAAALARRATVHNGFATEATARRLALLNADGEPERFRVETEDLHAGDGSPRGTRVTLTLALELPEPIGADAGADQDTPHANP